MSKLREKTVQDKALKELQAYYHKKNNVDCIYTCTEARTRKENGGKRADGLICFKTESGQYYTATMEAKSHRTLSALTSFVNEDKLGWHSLLAAISFTILTALILTTVLEIKWWITLLGVIPFFFVSLIGFIALFDRLNMHSHRLSGVIEQLKQYPANEQWVVYSRYADNLLASLAPNGKKSHIEFLDSLCRQNGYGLMLMGNQKTHIVMEPKPKPGSFLEVYSRAPKVRAALETQVASPETI